MKNLLIDNLTKAYEQVAKIRPTFCGELCFLLRKGASDRIETVESFYTAYGTKAIIVDKKDGQKYVVEIRPLRETGE